MDMLHIKATHTKQALRLMFSLCVGILLSFSSRAIAAPITNMYVFGDSLSDSGSLNFIAPSFCQPSPYAGCRASNGPVWVENLAVDLGVTADTAYGGGTNYAISGQTSGQVASGQLQQFTSDVGGIADSDALYVIWAGGNDFLQNTSSNPGDAVSNVLSTVNGLAALGAADFLVANLPILDPWALTFNSQLALGLSSIGGSLNITQLDVFGLFEDITLNPTTFGFDDVSTPCFDGLSVCSDPERFLLWDSIHPTAAAHREIAKTALASLSTPVSEPSSLFLMLMSLGGIAGLRSLRRSKIYNTV